MRPFAFKQSTCRLALFFKLFGLCASVSKTLASRQSSIKSGRAQQLAGRWTKDALLVTTQITNFKQCSENQP